MNMNSKTARVIVTNNAWHIIATQTTFLEEPRDKLMEGNILELFLHCQALF